MCLLLSATFSDAHTINYQLDRVSDKDIFNTYLLEGFKHIIPLGLDHILFILCIFFLNKNLKTVLMQATMFTIAHSVTLAMAVYGYINPPSQFIETIIALSIVFLALENIFFDKIKPWRFVMIFLFGLVHGMGFAGALSELGLPQYAMATALVSFNIGVEMGQLAIILLMYVLVYKLSKHNLLYRKWIVVPANVIIGIIASYWTIERMLQF